MKPSILIRPAADAELDEHANYLLRDNFDAAVRFLMAAEATFVELAEMPSLGSVWESPYKRLEGVRIRPIKGFENWLVFYRPIKGGIEILHVLHGARDIENILGTEKSGE